MSCTFDPDPPKLHKLGGGYYSCVYPYPTNDGLQIVHTTDMEVFKQIASNCQKIYIKGSKIIFSKGLFEGDTENVEYFIIDTACQNCLRRIDSATFNEKVVNLKKSNTMPDVSFPHANRNKR